jgi:drug/metabolite transporter (DMT)-like permease
MAPVVQAESTHPRHWAAGALLVNAFVWGVSWWPFRQLAQLGLHPLWTTALVYAFAVVVVLVFRPQAWRSLLAHPWVWVLALSSGLTNVGFNWAVTIGDVVRVVLLFYLMPAWAVLLAWPLLGEKPTPQALLRLALALAGVLLVLKRPDTAWPIPQSLADYLALMGGLCFALTNIMLRRLRFAPESTRMMGMFAGGSLLAGSMALWGGHDGSVPGLPIAQMPWLLLLGLAIAFLVSNLALQYGASRLRSGTTSLVMLSEIVFASVSSVVLGAAHVDVRTLAGGGLILLAALWAAWADGTASH